ncbi:unnamed protein product [Rangifer tarandus platyrhynchus]|uniref:Uncharacterized protein n=1 Tax=Rangifer tarandus platyrhynchus TaxID=3082113 RepID=A0ABN8YL07_RANTA|nr:unnamed protein product [Rangifer tarandus platyrhynchus]
MEGTGHEDSDPCRKLILDLYTRMQCKETRDETRDPTSMVTKNFGMFLAQGVGQAACGPQVDRLDAPPVRAAALAVATGCRC